MERKKLTQNFYEDEFHCPCCKKGKIDGHLLALLQDIRSAIGFPLKVSSAYRCPRHNAKVGGSENSDHMYGKAVDILCVDGGRRREIVYLALTVGIPSIGVKRDCVHLAMSEPMRIFTYD